MIGFRSSALIISAALLAPSPAAAGPVSPAGNATSNARVIHPVTVLKLADLDFGGISAASAGTVVIDPNTNAVTYTGGVFAAGGSAHPANFMGSALKKTVVNIRVPNQPTTLTRQGGTETLTVSTWTLQGQNKRDLAAQTTFTRTCEDRNDVDPSESF